MTPDVIPALRRSSATSHLVSAQELARWEPLIRRILASILWLLSLAGNVFAFGGGWDSLRWDRALLIAVVASVVYQVTCSAAQLVSCQRWRSNPLYSIALFASVVPSFVGYRPVVALPIVDWLAIRTDAESVWIGLAVHVLLLVALVAIDVVPERVFVRH